MPHLDNARLLLQVRRAFNYPTIISFGLQMVMRYQLAF
jgi:hypothetical protein